MLPRKSPSALVVAAAIVSCVPVNGPEAERPGSRTGETKITVTKVEPTEASASEEQPPAPAEPPAGPSSPAKPLEPAAKVTVSEPTPLATGSAAEAPLPLPTALATSKTQLFVFGRTAGGWIVRTQSTKAKTPGWSPPNVVVAGYVDDDAPFVIAEGDTAWFGVSSPTGGTRVARIDADGPTPKVTAVEKIPAKLGRVAAIVALKTHLVVIGRDGDAITFARLGRSEGFLDATAKVVARGRTATGNAHSRSPRATNEDEKVLLAWDSDEVSGALETPGTTAAERASPKPGIFVRRLFGTGEPSGPVRRLTRPSIEAHALDIVVELGACAVLAGTVDGFEMFRFIRKGDALDPYGGGLHLAPPGGDVALGADVIGTIGVTPTKLLRIGPGIKIVASPIGFSAPSGSNFEDIRIAMDGYGAHVVLVNKGATGALPTIARIEGEHMGPVLPTPWIGPPAQRLLTAELEGDEGLAVLVEGGAVQAVRLTADGAPKGTTAIPIEAKQGDALDWLNAPFPRAARGGGDWVLALRDGRALIATGPRAGTFLNVPAPKGAPVGGSLAVLPTRGKSPTVRVLYVPAPDRQTNLWTATIDPKQGTVSAWTSIPNTTHNYGALGGARFVALERPGGGLILLTNAGPKVSSVAQTYGLVAVDADGRAYEDEIDPPAPVQDISLAPTMGGPVILATITGKGIATHWLDGRVKGWRESFAYLPFRVKGDGPVIVDKGGLWAIPQGALPIELGAVASQYVGSRCRFTMAAGPRSLLLACEEGNGDSPLASRVTTRVLRF